MVAALRSRFYWLGVLSAATLFACAGAGVKYYGMDGVRFEEGKLLGPEPKYDLPFSQCKPDEIPDPENPGKVKLKHKCTVMFSKDFFSFKRDYEDCKMRLTECERYQP